MIKAPLIKAPVMKAAVIRADVIKADLIRGDVIPALELQSLSKTYRLKAGQGLFAKSVDHTVVQDVNLALMPNEILGLVGESGSGKTTTGMMALRLTEPTAGRILVGGTDITTLDSAALKPFRRRMQVVFQDSYSALDPMMTLEQIIVEPLHIHGLGNAASRRKTALDWLVRVGLHRNHAARYPHELSGGQRQRVAIARALLVAPASVADTAPDTPVGVVDATTAHADAGSQLLLLDDALSAVDTGTAARILAHLRLQRSGRSTLIVSHRLATVMDADQIVVLRHGRITERGSHLQLLALRQPDGTRGWYATQWQVQQLEASLDGDALVEAKHVA